MNKLVIAKLGSTLKTILSQRGDFEDWIISGLQIDHASAFIVNVCNLESFPEYGDVSGIVLTGSPAMITEHPYWSELTALWLVGAIERQIPILGICYGHQLLAYALGGKVGNNQNGLEFGTIDIFLNKKARDDPLFSGFQSPIRVHFTHAQSVLNLPDNAILLGSSDKEINQAFVVGDFAWGVQFHPEYDSMILREYIKHYKQLLVKEKKDPDHLIEKCADTPYGHEILSRFAKIVIERGCIRLS